MSKLNWAVITKKAAEGLMPNTVLFDEALRTGKITIVDRDGEPVYQCWGKTMDETLELINLVENAKKEIREISNG